MKNNFDLLKALCSIHAPSGNESLMTDFLLEYIQKQKSGWAVQPEIFYGDGFQNGIILVFGKPRTAIYAHIDSIGFTCRYENNLIKIGGPRAATGYKLNGSDSKGNIKCTLEADLESQELKAVFDRYIEPGTDLSFHCDFRSSGNYVQSCYLDNRLGVWNALQVAETLTDGVIVFSCWEEHGGGQAGYFSGFLFQKYGITQALICDITWITEGVHHGKGVVVSMRDSGIPRRSYVNRIRKILDENNFIYQVEVEATGGSDGNEIQKSPFPVDWCFVGAPEDNVHSPDEKVHKDDILSMVNAYKLLMDHL
ncbi:MAG: M20/M25/M40 family metallo-hydrolase [Bacteroidota bacterium]|nr:M20/M25/M40 family metallo-hydrolase [Bacteroidota bacterium]